MTKTKQQPFYGYQVRIALVRETAESKLPARYIKGSRDVADLMRELGDKDREHFAVIILDTKHRVLGVDVVSIGTLNGALVAPREVFKAAVLLNAAALIVCHNHPSGDPSPSPQDIEISKTLKLAGEIMHIQVLDHVIVTADSHCSMLDEGSF